MRDITTWTQTLRKKMGDSVPMKFSDFARTELMLYALQAYFPDQPIRKAHLLMQGYRESQMTEVQWQILKHLRHLAPEFQSSISWEIALRTYDGIAQSSASSWLGFEIDYAANHITLTEQMVLERYDLYEKMLTEEPLKFLKRKYKPATVGNYEFKINSQQTRVIQIPKDIADIGTQNAAKIPSIKLSKNRSAIQVSLTDLIQKGTELKSVLGYDAGQVLQQSTYWDIQKDKETTEIIIDKESHILGPTGSGKSTLIECLVTLLTSQKKRVAIATNSVGEVQDWLEFADKVGIKAVPIIGDSERHKHLSRLNQAVMFSNHQQPFTHPGFRWLSQCCPLYGLSQVQIPQSGEGQRIKPPCFGKLRDVNDIKKIYDCPLAPICPRHIKATELENAQLIVGTLPGFIHKKIAPHDLTENITILEYLALTSDLFIIDEVDLAQPKLDEIFYPILTLESFSSLQDTWTRTESYQHVHGILEGAVVVPRKYNDAYLEQSEYQRSLANQAIAALMYSMRNIALDFKGKKPNQEIEKLLKEYTQKEKLFTAWTLFDNLAKQLSGLAHVQKGTQKIRKQTLEKHQHHYERYREIFKRIQDDPVSPDPTGLNSTGLKMLERLERVSGRLQGKPESTVPHQDCLKFIQETQWEIKLNQLEPEVDRFIENLAKLLQLAIYSARALGALGKHLATRLQASIDLESTFPLTPPNDFNRFLPNSPVGSVTSAQFIDGQLKIYRGIALGRALLSQWNSIFSVDGLIPSHLLVTSATSYSGDIDQSYSFHVQLTPTLLIEPSPDKVKAVAHDSEFFYCPIVDDAGSPVFISGSQGDERKENISRMIAGLCRPSRQGNALLDQFQDYLVANVGSERENLLLITNSYAEAQAFYNSLKSPYKEKASYVVQDGNLWAMDSQVSRSKLTEFPNREKELLIAPIGAISRAVNLMHPSTGEPYFGGMVIVVRQHPSPDDNQIVVSGVNKETMDVIGRKPVEFIQKHARDVRDIF